MRPVFRQSHSCSLLMIFKSRRTVVLIQAGAEVLRVGGGEEGAHAAREQVPHHQRALEAHPLVCLEALQRRDCMVRRKGMSKVDPGNSVRTSPDAKLTAS